MNEKQRYIVAFRWWNGHGFDMTKKEVETKKQLLAVLKLLIDEIRPFQISVTDREQEPGIEYEMLDILQPDSEKETKK